MDRQNGFEYNIEYSISLREIIKSSEKHTGYWQISVCEVNPQNRQESEIRMNKRSRSKREEEYQAALVMKVPLQSK